MKASQKIIMECKDISDKLEAKADTFSLLYTGCILLAIFIGIVMLGRWIDDELINFIIGSVGLLATLVPLVFKKNIEKIQGYREVAMDFKNLEQDFSKTGESKGNLNTLKRLRKNLCNYPVSTRRKKRK